MNLSRPKLATAEAGFNKFSLSTGISAGKKTGKSGSKQVGNSISSSSGKDKGNVPSKGTDKDIPTAFKQTEFATSYEARLNQTPSPYNEKVGFEGIRGESKCILKLPPDPEIKKILDDAGVDGIEYKNAVPDFSPVVKAELKIDYMVGGTGNFAATARRLNFTQADEKLAELINNSPELARQFGMKPGEVTWKDIEKYRRKNKLTWHELNDVQTMQLVPTKINSTFGHLGGVGEINAGAFIPERFSNK